VYLDHKYFEEGSPFMLYKPRKDILFKLMRSCIDINDESKLWKIYNF
jgi:hypothetical protein